MTEHKQALLILGVVCWQVLCTDGLVWIDAPDEVVSVQKGSSIALHWHYEMEENEIFLSSEFVSNDRKSKGYYLLASRYEGESRYSYLSNKKHNKFAISGKNDVILTLFRAELGSRDSVYCCRVYLHSNKTTKREERCTTISIYVLCQPSVIFLVQSRNTRHTPQLYCKQGDQVKLQCNATEYPEPRVRWIHWNTKQIIGNSSVTLLNIIGKRSEGIYCCEVKNRFGRETACTTVKVRDPPKFTSKMSTRYTMTTKTIRITGSATGTPKPNITWTKENTEDVVSTGEHYDVPYVKCANKTLTFYCHASNVMGSIRSKVIQVQVMTQWNCTSDSNKEIITKEKNLPLIVGILCVILMAICLTVAVFIYWRKRKGITCQDKNPTDVDPYVEPVDTVVPSAEVLLPNRSTLPDGGYYNLKELGIRNAKNSHWPKEKESPYETLMG